MPERNATPAAAPPERLDPAPPSLVAAVASLSSAGPGRRFAPGEEAGCEFCGHPSLDRHCKVVCPRCGAVRDCSDP